MSYLGIDTIANLTPEHIRRAKDADVVFVGRYLVPASYSKAIKPDEAQRIRDAGLAILLCWEIGAEAVKGGAAKGAEDGAKALKCAKELGVPGGTVIYFACDYNIPAQDFIAAEKYIKAAQAVLGTKYHAGLYGPQKIVEFLHDRGACRYFWQCVAWSSRFVEAANVRQFQWSGSPDAKAMAAKIGVAVDLNSCDDLTGMWLPAIKEYDDGEGGTIVEYPKEEVKKPWYQDAMDWAAAQGLIKDGRPNDPVTRAELATVLYRMCGPEDNKTDSGLLSE